MNKDNSEREEDTLTLNMDQLGGIGESYFKHAIALLTIS